VITYRQTAVLIALAIAACAILGLAAAALVCPGCYWPPHPIADRGVRSADSPTTHPAADGRNPQSEIRNPQSPDPAGETADAIDATVAVLLSLLGPAGAIGGVLWGRLRPARTIKNLVESVQAGRNRIKAHAPHVLVDFDDTVRAVQDAATGAAVRTVKRKAHLRSVTHGDPPPPARPEKPDPMDTD